MLPDIQTAETMGEVILSKWCERCVNDAAFQAGMVGAPRCAIIERALGIDGLPPRRPIEWRRSAGNEPECSAFLSDIERDFHLADCA
jgi:hypothetical protein